MARDTESPAIPYKNDYHKKILENVQKYRLEWSVSRWSIFTVLIPEQRAAEAKELLRKFWIRAVNQTHGVQTPIEGETV